MAAPSYPSLQSRGAQQKSFHFDAALPLPEGVTKLCSDVFASEQTYVANTFSAASHHKSASKGQCAFLVSACQSMAQEVLQLMPARITAQLASAASQGDAPTVLEHPDNVAARDAIEKWTRLTKQAEADAEVFRKERLQRQARKGQHHPDAKVLAILSDEEKAFLKDHRGGRLSEALDSASASIAIKGDATLRSLQELQTFVETVQSDQRLIGKRINEEEKKAYGAAVDDPKSLIAMMTAGGSTTAAAAPAAAASTPMEQ
jgi:hypothetical protein